MNERSNGYRATVLAAEHGLLLISQPSHGPKRQNGFVSLDGRRGVVADVLALFIGDVGGVFAAAVVMGVLSAALNELDAGRPVNALRAYALAGRNVRELGGAIMGEAVSLASQVMARRARLPRPQTLDVVRERDLGAAMDDGALLLADRWVARETRGRPQPTVLVRSPYGRARATGLLFGRLLAERGLQVVIQSVRGTFGSGGTFSPFDERADGLATLRWIRRQPWHAGPIGMIGPSYLGLVQWAVAADPEADLGALAVQVTASQFHASLYAGGSVSLETAAKWLVLIAEQERRFPVIAITRAVRGLPALFSKLPLIDLDELATGEPVDWFREAAAYPRREDPYWAARDYAAGVATVTAPVQLIAGWYDIFLPWMLRDFGAMQEAGRRPQLIIGPWTHDAAGATVAGVRDGLGWLRAHLLGDHRLLRPAAVRVFVTGVPAGADADETAGGVDPSPGEGWRDLPRWPPPGTGERRLWLGDHETLIDQEPTDSPATGDAPGNPATGDRYRYDPADPTPSMGGPVLLARESVIDNRPLEARPDVLTYTAPPLPDALEAIGPVRVELYARSSSPFFDLFARVCDVDLEGASWNVSDALARVDPMQLRPQEDGSWRVAFDLWPIGHRFRAGHCIRLQVSSGAHPRYARNPGTGEDPFAATDLRPVEVEVLHDHAHPSYLSLPSRVRPA